MTPEVRDIALSMMEGLDCAYSLSVSLLIRYEEWDQLVSKRADPSVFLSAEDYFVSNAACEFLRKADMLPTSFDLDEVTLQKWRWAEQECHKTNIRLTPYLDSGPLSLGAGDDRLICLLIEQVRKNVTALVGHGPPSSLTGRFGPGATVSDRSFATNVADKMSSIPSFTPNALFFLFPWVETGWARASAHLGRRPVSVRGNEYFTVPKDSTTHRACGKEPSINVFFQLGLGRCLRERLLESKLDLDLGQNTHQRVAEAASFSGQFCTIDLKSASDCISTSLVKLLMPHGWFKALSDLRSPLTSVDGHWHYLEKFSSMGNGFTFELETTLFAAICLGTADVLSQEGLCSEARALRPGVDVFVYGDDIIVPTWLGKTVISVLKWFGFTPNPKKTFIEGNFRESCGGDYFNGQAVRPYHLESDPNEPQKLISLANGISRLFGKSCLSDRRRRSLRRTWFGILDRIPSPIRGCRGPSWLGDLVIHDIEKFWDTRWRAQLRYIRVYRPARFIEASFDRYAYEVQMMCALYGVNLFVAKSRGRIPRIREGFDGRVFHDRGDVQGYKVGWSNCP